LLNSNFFLDILHCLCSYILHKRRFC